MHNPISKPSAAAFLLRSVSFVALVVLGVAPPSGSAYAAQYLNAQSIVAGGYHFCAIVNGGAQCWGYSYNGQLGDGLFKDSTSPVLVEGLQSGVTAISAGGYHTCAIVNGGVKCWGRNPDGQLGDGTTSDSGVPVPVQGLGSGVIAISAGEYHTCAIVTGGSVRCWGWNSNGQLGNNSVNPTGTGAPVTVSNIASGATALAAGGYHTCALVSGGVQCWGYNGYGELDDGSETDRYIPVAAGGLASGVTAISAGLLHSCALVTGGTIHCWGGNDNGQLGNGTITLTGTNPPVTVSNIASGATAISAGGYLTCAVVSGAAKCWGSNYYGELGDGTLSEHHVPATVNGLSANVVGIAAAALTACARTSVAGVSQTQCWGDNVDGQVGQGDALFRYVPAAVPAITSGATALAQGAQGQHTCAIVGGAAKCWGDNQYGELGDNTYLLRPTPISVSGLSSGVTAIATGYLHTCAVVSGAAKCWGDNYYGMIGDGTNTR